MTQVISLFVLKEILTQADIFCRKVIMSQTVSVDLVITPVLVSGHRWFVHLSCDVLLSPFLSEDLAVAHSW